MCDTNIGDIYMKNDILAVASIFIILVATTGIVAGENEQDGGMGGGCLNRNALDSHTQTYDYLYMGKVVDGTVATYVLNTILNPQTSVIGYCVYPTPGFEGDVEDLTPLQAGWAIWPNNANKDYFGFERGQGGNEISIDGTTDINVGNVNYDDSRLPTSEVVLFHIYDQQECGPEDDTCWRRPGTAPPPPVPEASTVVLVSAGLLGLFIIARMYRK